MKRFLIVLAFLCLPVLVHAQEAWVDGGDTASQWSQSQDTGHWEDQGYWYRDEDSWAYEEYWVWVPDSQDKNVIINDEQVYIAAQNQCTQANPCIAWGPATVWGAHQGAIITGDFVLYDVSADGGTITWQIRGDGGMTWVGSPSSCGRCRWQLISAIENPAVSIVWWGSAKSFRVAMENITIDYNPMPPPISPLKQIIKDEAASSRDRARGYADALNVFATLYAGKLDVYRAGVLKIGAEIEKLYANWQDNIANDPPENDCSAWPVAPVDLNYLLTGDGQLDAVVAQASYYLAWLESAFHSANRYSAGCGDWQRDAAINSLRYAGANMYYNGFAWVAGTLREYGDLYDPNGYTNHGYVGDTAASILEKIDQEMRDTGNFYQQQ